MTRTDPHRPSAIDPANYEYVGAYYAGISEDMMDAYLPEHDYLIRECKVPAEALDQTKCDHCGQRFAHGVIYRYVVDGERVHVGHICAAETMSLPDRARLVRKRAESAAATARERRKVWESQSDEAKAAHAYWHGPDGDFAPLAAFVDRTGGGYAYFVTDLVHKMRKYTLSERQEAALLKATRQAQEHDAKPEPEYAPKVPQDEIPTGRTVISGRVVAVKFYDNAYGGYSAASVVVTREDGAEWLAWLKCTSTFSPERGDEVTVKTTLDPQDDGFAKGTRSTTKGV